MKLEINDLIQKLIDTCEYIIAVDKTPDYKYGQVDNKGKKPSIGSRWKSPNEYCRDQLKVINKLQKEATRKLK
jgi:hypothetical protein